MASTKQIEIDQYSRKKGGKTEIVSAHTKMIKIKPQFAHIDRKKILNDKAKHLFEPSKKNKLNLQANYYEVNFPFKFDGIVTDIPFKDSIVKKKKGGGTEGILDSDLFDAKEFLTKTYHDTKPAVIGDKVANSDSAFLITFTDLNNLLDMSEKAREMEKDPNSDVCWKLHTMQVWDTRPNGNWRQVSKPRRHSMLIVYFIKGKKNAKGICKYPSGDTVLDFRTGELVGDVKRSPSNLVEGFGGTTTKISHGYYHDIVPTHKNIGNEIPKDIKIHPTQKPEIFGQMFEDIVSTKGLDRENNQLWIIDDKLVLDTYGGSTELVKTFNNSVAIDIKNWGDKYDTVESEKEQQELLREFYDQVKEHKKQIKKIKKDVIASA